MKLGVTVLMVFAWVCAAQANSVQASEPTIFCYFTSWTLYRPGNGKFDVEDIDPFLCSHVAFAFVGLQHNGSIAILDPWESNSKSLDGFDRLANLKEQNPDLKVLISMGGWNEMSSNYSEVASNATKRAILTNEVLDFLGNHNYDGFDLDWQYPARRDSENPDDKENLVLLLQEMKGAFEESGYILSAAVNGGRKNIDVSYNVGALSDAVDYINIMSFDFHGAFDGYVGHHTLLYSAGIDDRYNNLYWDVDDGITYWLEQGADPEKINFGIATYARTFTMQNPSNTSLYTPITGGGTPGPYTKIDGVLGYNEICELYSDVHDVYDTEQLVYHKVIDDQWIGYENADSIQTKVKYALSQNISGFMIWSLDTDDFTGFCGDGKYPLINTVKKTFANYK